MKTAEEWTEDIWNAEKHLSAEHLHDTELPAIVRAIQLDALNEAAKLVPLDVKHITPDEKCSMRAILSRAEQLKQQTK